MCPSDLRSPWSQQVAIGALSRPAFAAPLVTAPLVIAAAWCLRARWVVLLQPRHASSQPGLLGAGLGRSQAPPPRQNQACLGGGLYPKGSPLSSDFARSLHGDEHQGPPTSIKARSSVVAGGRASRLEVRGARDSKDSTLSCL